MNDFVVVSTVLMIRDENKYVFFFFKSQDRTRPKNARPSISGC